MILVVIPMQNAIWWCHATGEHAQVRAGRNVTRVPALISSPPLRPFSFVAGIDMIWHQMRARSAIAAAFFTIALLRFRKTVVQTA